MALTQDAHCALCIFLPPGWDIFPLLLHGQEEETPLHCAAWHGYHPVARALCEAGCDVNIKNREGETPLLTASARGYHDIVECLAEHGADLNASDKVRYRVTVLLSERWTGGQLGGRQGDAVCLL